MMQTRKKLTFLLLLGGASMATIAAPLSPKEALDRMALSSKASIPSKIMADRSRLQKEAVLKYTFDDNTLPTIYIFNVDGATVCLSADDEVTPVLGYAEGISDAEQFPPSFKAWLSTISEEIAAVRNGEKSASYALAPETGEDYEAIAPMMATKWNQDAPYNLKCPMVNKVQAYTGCVATAMAQVMKYHNWPETGEGKIEYQWKDYNLKLNYGNQTYLWDQMLDSYTGDYTDEEANAVAQLMKSCGYSVQMNYSTSASGAMSQYIAGALGSYFKYDRSKLRYVMRDYYTLEVWENMIYTSLKEYGPVILDGQSKQGGHSFVCDGYDKEGYFHINWGWGGISDGYYLLSVLDPYNQGIGGSGDNSGFNFMQDAVLNIVPAKGENPENGWFAQMYGYGEFGLDTSLEYAPGNQVGPLCNDGIYNYGPAPLPADTQMGILFREEKGEGEYGEEYGQAFELEQVVDVLYGFGQFKLPLPEELPEGKYKVTLSYHAPTLNWNQWIDVLFDDSVPTAYEATVSDGVIRFEDSTWRPSKVEDFAQYEGSEPARYFNLQGMPVGEPEKGSIVIVKEGMKSYKKLF